MIANVLRVSDKNINHSEYLAQADSDLDSDAQAIEDGNWEDVAASTKAYANRNENIKHGDIVDSVRAPADFKKLRQAWEV